MQQANVILVSIDTLRYDHLSCYGYNRMTTPNIDRFAEKGVLFTNAYSTAVWTPPAHASMLTGLYPSQHGVINKNRLNNNIPTMAEILKNSGYQTAGFANNCQVGSLVGLDRGFDQFYEVWQGYRRNQIFKLGIEKIKSKLHYADKGAKRTIELISKWLLKERKLDQPFYLFIHLIEPHNPLMAPKPFLYKYLDKIFSDKNNMKNVGEFAQNPLVYYIKELNLSDEENQALIALYDEEISYTDHIMGQLIQLFKKNKVFDNSFIIITADHGEHFGEHSLYSHVASLYEEIVHIPMILRYPGVDPSQSDFPVQLIDILPSVIEATNITYENYKVLPGKSFFNLQHENKSERCLFAEWEGRIPSFIEKKLEEKNKVIDLNYLKRKLEMIKCNNLKFIKSSDSTEELYDLALDPDEKINLANEHVTIKKQLEKKLIHFKNSISSYAIDTQYVADEVVIKNLEALGYL